jgi:hypothetical protein
VRAVNGAESENDVFRRIRDGRVGGECDWFMENSERLLVAYLEKLRKTLKDPMRTDSEKGGDESGYKLFVYLHRILMPKWGITGQKLVY